MIVPDMARAELADWDTEYLDKILAVAVVESLDEAIAHITNHGSGHTEAIVTSDLAAARRFVAEVDSSAVMVNASSTDSRTAANSDSGPRSGSAPTRSTPADPAGSAS